jgi:hypothetical protein
MQAESEKRVNKSNKNNKTQSNNQISRVCFPAHINTFIGGKIMLNMFFISTNS